MENFETPYRFEEITNRQQRNQKNQNSIWFFFRYYSSGAAIGAVITLLLTTLMPGYVAFSLFIGLIFSFCCVLLSVHFWKWDTEAMGLWDFLNKEDLELFEALVHLNKHFHNFKSSITMQKRLPIGHELKILMEKDLELGEEQAKQKKLMEERKLKDDFLRT